MTNTPETLEQRYAEILSDLPDRYLNRSADASGKLSSVFLVSGPRDMHAHKIMVIGRECGWNWNVAAYKGGGVQAYISEALKLHREKFERWMGKKKTGATFFGFMRAIAQRVGSSDGLIYSNLFCFDVAGGHPGASKDHYDTVIEPLSGRLLKAQIEHFNPDLIIFANGISSKDVRRKFFPHQEGVVQGVRDWSAEPHRIPNGQLWEFNLYGKYRCLRIQHPSAYSREAIRAREFVVNHLLTA